MRRESVAMTAEVDDQLRRHLLRDDGQEDLCLALYAPSVGSERSTALISELALPRLGERSVHGNASFTGDYVTRVATLATKRGLGVAILHSHPSGRTWQEMSGPDIDAEQAFAYLLHAATGLPLVGMTLAGATSTWSARIWSADRVPTDAESVRVIGSNLRASWNPSLRPTPPETGSQVRTISTWGPTTQADLARLRVLVVGAGSIGLEIAVRLAASGVQRIGVMDFDTVEEINLDRLIGATRTDARLRRSKLQVAERLMKAAATAKQFDLHLHESSVCEPSGLAIALDYDVIFSCVDRPFPRSILNSIAHADLIPVIDGGIAIDVFDDLSMRSASWRSHILIPGRPCLFCNGQLRPEDVATDREGLLDDALYIAGAGAELGLSKPNQNVALLSAAASSSMMTQFVSFIANPGGRGEPGPLQYHLAGHSLEHVVYELNPRCPWESKVAVGAKRIPLAAKHPKAHEVIGIRRKARRTLSIRIGEMRSKFAKWVGGESR